MAKRDLFPAQRGLVFKKRGYVFGVRALISDDLRLTGVRSDEKRSFHHLVRLDVAAIVGRVPHAAFGIAPRGGARPTSVVRRRSPDRAALHDHTPLLSG